MADEVQNELDNQSNIVESSTDSNSFFLKPGDTINGKSLNRIFSILAKNDEVIAGNFKNVPGIWFCKWYDNEREKGYNKGDFFWVNTENAENFIRDNNKKIRELANKNPYVLKKLPPWKNNDSEIFDMYYNVLTGYFDDKVSKRLYPMYYLGEISNNFQIIVSQKDQNKDIPGTVEALSSWKHFAVNTDEDYENILFIINKYITEAINRHENTYHLPTAQITQKDIDAILSNYMDEDFSNVNFPYPKNYISNDFHTTGMDCVTAYVRKPYANRKVGKFYIEETWFRKWKSGYLEHGGIIDVRNYLNDYGDLVTIPFKWKLLDSGSKFYQLDYLGINSQTAINVNESYQKPPGDNLISVLHELDNLIVDNSEYSPIYYSDNYTVSLVPIQQQFTLENDIGNVDSYSELGNYSVNENVLNVVIDSEHSTKEYFSFKYNANTTPRYYSYYVTGFCL